jgi:hypothetical protein
LSTAYINVKTDGSLRRIKLPSWSWFIDNDVTLHDVDDENDDVLMIVMMMIMLAMLMMMFNV